MNYFIKYFCIIQTLCCINTLFCTQAVPQAQAAPRPLVRVTPGDALLKRVDNLAHTLDSVNQTVNNGIQETNKRLDAVIAESNEWRNTVKTLIIQGTTAVLAVMLVATALFLIYHDHTITAQITTPLPAVRLIDRFKKHLLSKSTGFFCLGALAYRQLCAAA